MPTETFYNLPEAKREKLARAIQEELARVPFSEMSINRIVQAAGIPRGSYYQYFEDREDLFSYLISDYQKLMLQAAVGALTRSGGDMFAAALALYEESAAFVREAGNRKLVTHLFNEVKRRLPFSSCEAGRETRIEAIAPVLSLIDKSVLRAESDSELAEMVAILFSVLGGSVLDTITAEDPDKVRERLSWRLDILKNGMGRTLA